MEYKKISVTGTPGTGKTVVSKLLAERLGYRLIKVNDVVKKKSVETTKDEKRDTVSVDTESLKKVLSNIVEDNTVLEGHLSHYFCSEIVVVLRCSPDGLESRLSKRNWSREKISENVESEAVGVILSEAVELCEKVVEVDTTGKSVDQVVDVLEKIVSGKVSTQKFEPGSVDWSSFLGKM